MKKRFADGIAILSIALLILFLADWHHSYFKSEAILFSGPAGRPLIIASGRGVLYVAVVNVPVTNSLPWSCDLRSASGDGPENRFEEAAESSDLHIGYHVVPVTSGPMAGAAATAARNAYGFSFLAGKNIVGVPGTFYALASVPFWAVVPPLGFVSFFWMRKKLQHLMRYREGCCRKCGYDLRASPERCPECGTAIVGGGG